MSTILRLCLLLTAFSTLVASKPTHSPNTPTVYNNCSGHGYVSLPDSAASTPFFQPQIRANPDGNHKKCIGWEEWVFLAHNRLADGTELIYSYEWVFGDPASANDTGHTFVAWALFPNGTLYNQIAQGEFKYEERADGGFTYSIGKNHLIWDPVHELWNTSVNAGGWIIETHTRK